MGKIVGIDLGTTNSLLAHFGAKGPRVVPLPSGDTHLPSVVAVDSVRGLLVGKAARQSGRADPEHSIFSVKRHMGKDHSFFLGGEELRPQEISAMILRELKRAAEAHFLGPADRAVISVPAYFNELQRRATREAGELAGFHVERLISEPTAAALAYGVEHIDAEEYILVYDLGGGTFDVSVLEMFEGIFNVRASSGDSQLGGDDFDDILTQDCRKRLISQLGSREITPQGLALLWAAAEAAKRELTEKTDAKISLELLPLAEGDGTPISLTVTREHFEGLTRKLLERTGACVAKVLAEARVPKEKIGSVLLVGGSTRMPMVRTYLTEYFGRPPEDAIDPMQAVALGAAVQANLLEATPAMDEIMVTDVSPFTLGVSVMSEVGGQLRPGVFDPLIPRNASLPATCEKTFSTLHPQQDTVNIEVYQGDDPLVENNVFLDHYFIGGIPTGSDKPQDLTITFRYDTDGILHVTAVIESTGKSAGIQIDNRKMQSVGFALEPARAKVDRLWRRSEAARVLQELVERIQRQLDTLPSGVRSQVASRLDCARDILQRNDPHGIEALVGELSLWDKQGGDDDRTAP